MPLILRSRVRNGPSPFLRHSIGQRQFKLGQGISLFNGRDTLHRLLWLEQLANIFGDICYTLQELFRDRMTFFLSSLFCSLM